MEGKASTKPPTPTSPPEKEEDYEVLSPLEVDKGLRMAQWMYNPYDKAKEPDHWKELIGHASHNGIVERRRILNDKALAHLCLAECEGQRPIYQPKVKCERCRKPTACFYTHVCPHCEDAAFVQAGLGEKDACWCHS